MRARTRATSVLLIGILMTAGLPTGAFAQDDGDDGDGDTGLSYPDPITTGLPRQNVTGSATASRAPGTWILSATGRFAELHRRSIDEFGGADFNQGPRPEPRRRTFLLAFLPQAFAIINELIQAYILAIQAGGQTSTTQPS